MADWKGRKRKSRSQRQSLKPTLNELQAALSEFLDDIQAEIYEKVDRGLDKATEYLKGKLEDATPVDSGITRGQWEADLRYTNVRYINNVQCNENGIPIVNLLEFGSRGKPFVRKTVAESQNEVINIIKGEIENGKS